MGALTPSKMDICIAVAPTREDLDGWNAFDDGTSGFFATNDLLCGATNAFAEEARVSDTIRAIMFVADAFMMM